MGLENREHGRRHARIALPAGLGLAVAAAGWLVAETVTRPLGVTLRTHIQIYEKGAGGSWSVIDEVGPATVRFEASLLDMTSSRTIATAYTLDTRSRNGVRYTARLAAPAKVAFNPATGRLDGELAFDVSYGEWSARVPATLTTESRPGPLGTLRGRRARGLLGQSETTTTVVSVNPFRATGRSELLLACTEEYVLTPRPRS